MNTNEQLGICPHCGNEEVRITDEYLYCFGRKVVYCDYCDSMFALDAINATEEDLIKAYNKRDSDEAIGTWDEIPNTYMSVASKDGSYSGNATSCSVCHEVNPNAYKTNYCPNCGKKMNRRANDGTA